MLLVWAWLIGFLEGVLVLPVAIAVVVPGVTGCAALWLPVVAQDALAAFLVTPRASLPLKVLCACTVWPVLILLWVPGCLLLSVAAALECVANPLRVEIRAAQSSDYRFRFEGYVQTVDRVLACPGVAWAVHRDTVPDCLADLRRAKADGTPLAVPLWQWPYCAVLVVLGMLVVGLGVTVQCVVKLFPAAFALTARMFPQHARGPMWCLVKTVVGFFGPLLCLPVALLGMAIAIPSALLCGAGAPFVAVGGPDRRVHAAWGVMREWLVRFDAWTNRCVFASAPTPVVCGCVDNPSELKSPGGSDDAQDWTAVWFGDAPRTAARGEHFVLWPAPHSVDSTPPAEALACELSDWAPWPRAMAPTTEELTARQVLDCAAAACGFAGARALRCGMLRAAEFQTDGGAKRLLTVLPTLASLAAVAATPSARALTCSLPNMTLTAAALPQGGVQGQIAQRVWQIFGRAQRLASALRLTFDDNVWLHWLISTGAQEIVPQGCTAPTGARREELFGLAAAAQQCGRLLRFLPPFKLRLRLVLAAIRDACDQRAGAAPRRRESSRKQQRLPQDDYGAQLAQSFASLDWDVTPTPTLPNSERLPVPAQRSPQQRPSEARASPNQRPAPVPFPPSGPQPLDRGMTYSMVGEEGEYTSEPSDGMQKVTTLPSSGTIDDTQV